MIIKGTVSRLVDPEGQFQRPRVFVRPSNPADLRNVDGSQQTGAGEVMANVDSLAAWKIGAPCVYDVVAGTLAPAAPVAPVAEDLGDVGQAP